LAPALVARQTDLVTILPDFGERYLQTALFDHCRYEGSDEVTAS
jgi:hypothetical protein